MTKPELPTIAPIGTLTDHDEEDIIKEVIYPKEREETKNKLPMMIECDRIWNPWANNRKGSWQDEHIRLILERTGNLIFNRYAVKVIHYPDGRGLIWSGFATKKYRYFNSLFDAKDYYNTMKHRYKLKEME